MLPRPHPAVTAQTVSDGSVLLHMETEIYFGLNSVGTKVWELLPPECTELEELCRRLADTYPDVEPEMLRQDVAELLEMLQENELVLSPELA